MDQELGLGHGEGCLFRTSDQGSVATAASWTQQQRLALFIKEISHNTFLNYCSIAHTFCQWKFWSYADAESFAWRQRHIFIDFHINIINLTLVLGMFLLCCPSNHID